MAKYKRTQVNKISAFTEIAIEAGNEILDVYYNSDFDVETLVDKGAHKVIVSI